MAALKLASAVRPFTSPSPLLFLRRAGSHLAPGKRVVVVTGGSSGIGLGISRAFLQDGAVVVSGDIDENANVNLREIGGHAVNADVSQKEACKRLVDFAFDKFNRIDVLVNNAAIQPVPSCVPLHTLPDDLWHKLIAVNLSSVFHMSKLVLPIMLKQREETKSRAPEDVFRGVVINVASVQGIQSQKGVPAYAASKGGVLSLTRQMANEYGEYGIRVLAINPGTVKTGLVDQLLANAGKTYEDAGVNYPLEKRCGTIDEIGHVAVFLASNKASYMTGCSINVDGGILSRGGWST